MTDIADTDADRDAIAQSDRWRSRVSRGLLALAGARLLSELAISVTHFVFDVVLRFGREDAPPTDTMVAWVGTVGLVRTVGFGVAYAVSVWWLTTPWPAAQGAFPQRLARVLRVSVVVLFPLGILLTKTVGAALGSHPALGEGLRAIAPTFYLVTLLLFFAAVMRAAGDARFDGLVRGLLWTYPIPVVVAVLGATASGPLPVGTGVNVWTLAQQVSGGLWRTALTLALVWAWSQLRAAPSTTEASDE